MLPSVEIVTPNTVKPEPETAVTALLISVAVKELFRFAMLFLVFVDTSIASRRSDARYPAKKNPASLHRRVFAVLA